MRRKADLPTKTCVVCGRPFAWRKKWARDWDAVTTCSERCRRMRRAGTRSPDTAASALGSGDRGGEPTRS